VGTSGKLLQYTCNAAYFAHTSCESFAGVLVDFGRRQMTALQDFVEVSDMTGEFFT
jgi:hypothetical protein